MRKYKNLFLIILFINLIGCSMNMSQATTDKQNESETEDTTYVDTVTGATKTEANFAVLAGGSFGGIVVNDNKQGVNGVSDVDAISGASKIAYNAGFHSVLKGHGRTMEIGIDYIKLENSIEYDMPSLSVNGTRTFETHQIRLPITYNFEFLKNDLKQPKFVLKVGASPGYIISKKITDSEDSENMPDYEFSDWDVCGKIGLSYYPFDFNQYYRIGLYLDAYRGFKTYDDIYHEAAYLGGNAFLKFGVIYKP
jgi:hypothetical protein